MEVIQYEEPRSWDDFGMDWNDPDPRCAHYMMALRNAFFERMAAAADDVYMYSYNVQRLSPWKAVTTDQLRNVVAGFETLCRAYYNLDPEAYKDDLSDFPKRMRLSDVLTEDDCDAFMNASRGAILEHGGEWMRKIRNAICKFHVVECRRAWGTTLTRSGAEHDPPFDESIGKAFEHAFGENQPGESEFKQTVPRSIYAWSGNNHWKCPRPVEDGQDDWEGNVDGYCGYAYSVAYRFRRIRRWLAGSEVDLVLAAVLDSPTGPTGWSNELATSVFDTGDSGFRRGLNLSRTHVEDPADMDYTFGDLDSIPRNEVVPQSDFDSEGNAIWRRSAKRGYEGKVYAFLDYECNNGFRFRAPAGSGAYGG